MQKLLDLIGRSIRVVALMLLVVLVAAMAVQVGGRHLFLRGVPYTDEIAMISLTWIAFLAIPWVYRLRQHIAVHLPLIEPNSRAARALEIVVHAAVIALMVLIVRIGWDMAAMTSRIFPGTLPVSRFQMHFLPLLVGSTLTILFALEAIAKVWTRPGDAPA